MFHHDSRRTGKTTAFGTSIGKLKWVFPTGAPVTSSPAIDEKQILYVGSTDNYLYAINADTGFLSWKYRTGGEISHSSPAIDDDGMLYIGSSDGYLYAFDTTGVDTNNPQYQWRYKTGGAIESSPAIDESGNIIFGSADGCLYALYPSGNLKWKSQNLGTTSCSPAIDDERNQVYIGSYVDGYNNSNFYAVNSETGGIVWTYPFFCGGIFASPLVTSDSSVIVSTFTTYFNETVLCSYEGNLYHIYNMSPDDEHTFDYIYIYGTDNQTIEGIAGEEVSSGSDGRGDVNWKLLEAGQDDVYGTPALLGDNSFIVASASNLYRVLPDANNYYDYGLAGQRMESSPAIDGRRYIFTGSNGGRFYCLHADRPEKKIVWMYPPEDREPLDAEILSSPAIGGDSHNSVYVGASNGNIYAFYDGLKIEGTVYAADNASGTAPLPSVKMILGSGDGETAEQTTFTDELGSYSFSIEPNYTYAVTAEKPGYVFDPESASVTVRVTDVDGIDFTGRLFEGITLSGRVADIAGNPVQGVLITVEGEKGFAGSTQTDAAGAYEIAGLEYDTFTITPSRSNYSFIPSQKVITVTPADDVYQENNDFTAYSGDQVSVSGYVVLDNEPLADVTVMLEGYFSGTQALPPVSTNTDGLFRFLGVGPGTYRVKPSHAGYGFDPLSRRVTVINASSDDNNFKAVEGLYIAGKATVIGGDSFAQALTIDVADSQGQIAASVTPDDSGAYSVLGLAAERYTLTPQAADLKSIPESQTVDLIFTSREEIDFLLYPVCPTVFITWPFYGSQGAEVSILGMNFGYYEPDDSAGGVYFGTRDAGTRQKAEVLSWTPVLIRAVVPEGRGIVSVWVEVQQQTACSGAAVPTNFFVYDDLFGGFE